MKKRLLMIPLALVFLLLDTAAFPAFALFDIRPWMCLALAMAATQADSVRAGMIIAGVTGFFIDLICNTYLGVSSALYILSCIAIALVLRKNAIKWPLMAGLCCLLCFMVGCANCVIAWAMGAKLYILWEMGAYILPCALLSGGVSMLLMQTFKSMSKGQIERQSDEKA
ncbi:MAG TPA: hypothetical protein P5116_01640 [Eubacteriales bacterium]|nr:hypothetical protein [Clostridia bacterium]HRV72564.1 hypothetical protein [Eubacteriales bacterium]